MVLDTSALLAILFEEPECQLFTRLLERDPVRLLSAANRVEAAMAVEGRKGEGARTLFERMLSEAEIEVVPVTAEQAMIACEAFRRYGRGRHRAGLNFGDVFAYALSKAVGEPLLFKGDDFSHTDVERAL